VIVEKGVAFPVTDRRVQTIRYSPAVVIRIPASANLDETATETGMNNAADDEILAW
jgi:hypothetical protein